MLVGNGWAVGFSSDVCRSEAHQSLLKLQQTLSDRLSHHCLNVIEHYFFITSDHDKGKQKHISNPFFFQVPVLG